MDGDRVAWVDTAKGLCIIMVVMMHSTLGVENAAGEPSWLHPFIEFAQPFRMPDFFLISGLFLARVIDRPWTDYLDRKVVHFAYFYLLWLTIQWSFKWPAVAIEEGMGAVASAILLSLVEPFGTLWFIYLLPVFFVVTKLARPLPPLSVWLAAAVLEALPIATGWTVIDEFASRYVYFLTGFYAAPLVFALAGRVAERQRAAVAGLAVWAFVNGVLVGAGAATLPGLSLVLGLAGAVAVVTIAALLEGSGGAAPIRFAGQHSITVYLAFFLPMAVTRTVLLKLGIVPDPGTVAAIVTIVAVIVPLMLDALVRGTVLYFLFERPIWARLSPAHRRASLVAAE
jgi:uncharacterized membrane protein YcfT